MQTAKDEKGRQLGATKGKAPLPTPAPMPLVHFLFRKVKELNPSFFEADPKQRATIEQKKKEMLRNSFKSGHSKGTPAI